MTFYQTKRCLQWIFFSIPTTPAVRFMNGRMAKNDVPRLKPALSAKQDRRATSHAPLSERNEIWVPPNRRRLRAGKHRLSRFAASLSQTGLRMLSRSEYGPAALIGDHRARAAVRDPGCRGFGFKIAASRTSPGYRHGHGCGSMEIAAGAPGKTMLYDALTDFCDEIH